MMARLLLAALLGAMIAVTPINADAGRSKTPGVQRDKHGKIARSSKAKTQFKQSHPCPSTGKRSGACPGYVIDHVTPLKRGGVDDPSNMQWQAREAARQKDRYE